MPTPTSKQPSPNEARYLQALISPSWQVLGVRLRPFSIGHYAILTHFENPYIVGGESSGIEDLVFGVWVCGQTYADAIDGIEKEQYTEDAREIGKQAGNDFDLIEKVNLFCEYIADGTDSPDYWESDGNSKKLGAPAIGSIRVGLMKLIGIPPSEINDYPMALALWDLSVAQEMEGNISLVSDEQHIQADLAKHWFDQSQGRN